MAGYSVTYTVVDNATKQIDAINRRIQQMRAPMDRLSKQVSRFVDLSGLKKVAEGFEWIGRAVGSVVRSMVSLVPIFGALIGAGSIAGMIKLVSTFSEWSSVLEQDADSVGMTTQQLQKFQDATRLAGGDTADMTEALKSLHTASANAFVGLASPEQIQWFNRLGISFRDANGHLRDTAQLLPEVIQAISNIQDPADRARASAALLGDANAKLVETFRQSHRSFGEWLTDASRYTALTEAQKAALQRFGEAQGRISTAFDHLGQQVASVLARNFTPLINKLSEFVEVHSPEIIAAVDRISTQFVQWLEHIDWTKVQAGIDPLVAGLMLLIDNLDTVVRVAEGIAVLFAIKWGVGMVAAIAQVTAAIGAVGAGGIGGVGLLGGLSAVAALATTLALKGDTGPGGPAPETPAQRDAARQKVDELNAGSGYTGHFWHDLGVGIGKAWRGVGNYGSTPGAPNISSEVPDAGRALLKQIAGGESNGGDPTILYGGGHFTDTSKFPEWAGKMGPEGISHAAGRYQFQPGTWKTASKGAGVTDFSPESQDKAAWWLAQHDYQARTGRDLATDLKDPTKAKQIGAVLHPTWTSANAGAWGDQLRTKLATAPPPPVASAPPAVVPPTASVNGKVDVAITHKNPPANSSVTAQGSGAVNVGSPRVEHQDMAAI